MSTCWQRKCDRCGRHEIANKSGNSLLYDEAAAKIRLKYKEISEAKNDFENNCKRRDKNFGTMKTIITFFLIILFASCTKQNPDPCLVCKWPKDTTIIKPPIKIVNHEIY